MTHEELKARALANAKVKVEYEILEPEFALLRAVLLARQQSGLSQGEIAEKMGMRPSAIRQLESALINGDKLPSLTRIKKYAEALNCHLEIRLVHNE
jgi:ribosome-binding protein aMBF1 (putative translation factor)